MSLFIGEEARGGAPRTNIKQASLFVDREDLDEQAKHPALLITTTVEMPHSVARNVVNSLRGLMTDNATQGMLTVGDTKSIVLTGFGANILDIVEMLEDIDRTVSERSARNIATRAAEAAREGPASDADDE